MSSPESRLFSAALAHRAGPAPSAAQLADGVIALWRDVESELSPIVGARGVAALHRRSVFLVSPDFPWMLPATGGIQEPMDLGSLRNMLAMRSAVEAHAGGCALLETFHELLTSMVGSTLTEQLLSAVWDRPSSGQPAQDATP